MTTNRLLALLLALCLLLPGGLPAEGTAMLNLKDADIRTLIRTVAEITGRNFVIDPRVKGKVTVISSKPMQKDEIYEVFLSILQVHGFSAVQTGEVIKIVPDVTAKQGPVPLVSQGARTEADELVTRVVPVEHVPAAQLVPILRPLVPQQGLLAAYAPSNTLTITDRAANIDRLVRIIRRIDRAESDDIEVIPLEHASASEVVRIINALNRKAPGKGSVGKYLLTADERTNTVLIAGDKASRLKIRGIIAHLDTPIETDGQTQVVFLKYAKAKDLAAILDKVARQSSGKKGKGSPGTTGSSGNISIQADEANNALVITASPAIQRSLRSVIRQLDIRRKQILVESVIAEVGINLTTQLGVQFAVDGRNTTNQLPVGVTSLGGPGNSLVSLYQNPGSLGAGLTLAVGRLVGDVQFGALIRALQGDAATNILSTPTLVTLDNEEAEIIVGQNVPFVTGQYTSTGSGEGVTNPFQTIERNDIGIKLKLKPQINEGDSIRLEIHQEASALAASSVALKEKIVNKREIKTVVMAEDGQIIVLGGLIEDTFRDNVQKVPLLGDIPVLGQLFRFTETDKIKQNLMVFIHPVILRDRGTADAYTERKYSYLKASQMEGNLLERGILSGHARKLPDFDELLTILPDEAPAAPTAPAGPPEPARGDS